MLHIIYNSKENDAIYGFSVIKKADLSSWGHEKIQRPGGEIHAIIVIKTGGG
jgi:hypothetical protein